MTALAFMVFVVLQALGLDIPDRGATAALAVAIVWDFCLFTHMRRESR